MRTPMANAPRRWWLAASLAIAGRGVGQLYNGEPIKAGLAYLAPLGVLFLANRAPVADAAQALLILYAALLVWAVADAAAVAFAHRSAFLAGRWNRTGLHLLAIVAVHGADTILFGNVLLRVMRVPDGSMSPAIAARDSVVVDLAGYLASSPLRGDIIAFRSPVDERSARLSRVIGLPGETVEIRAKQVFIDGRPLRENWSVHRDTRILWPTGPSPRDHFGPQRLPADGYFVLDDNRDTGFDSRYWGRPVRRRMIDGKAGIVAFARDARGAIQWERIGTFAQRDVPVPTDAPAALYGAMAADPTLSAGGMRALLGIGVLAALAVPLFEMRRRRRRQRHAAIPYSVTAGASACAPHRVRIAVATADSTPAERVAALAVLAKTPERRPAAPIDVPVAACLEGLDISRLQADELEKVATHLGRISSVANLDDIAVRGLVHWRCAAARQRLARIRNDRQELAAAVEVYRQALASTPVAHAPLRWAAVQNDLGTALQQLGEATLDTEILESAVAAYRAALTKRTRRTAAVDWATTQHNLGNGLRVLGEHSGNVRRWIESANAYRAALAHRSKESDPIGRAMTLNNLGTTLRLIGARRGDAGVILQALRLHRESHATFERLAPAFAEVPAANIRDDEDLLERMGMLPRQSPSSERRLATEFAAA